MQIYLEIGQKRTFAGAIDWPGWQRGGRSESDALQALLDSAPRYRQVIAAADGPEVSLAFKPPETLDGFTIVERLKGSASTDFGAPGRIPSADQQLLEGEDLARCAALLAASFDTLSPVAQAAQDVDLRKGPRGGGRDLAGILAHVLEANAAYLRQLGWKLDAAPDPSNPAQSIHTARTASLDALHASARGELPTVGPRGGRRWPPRYFTRRAAWHILDHAWEVEDRRE